MTDPSYPLASAVLETALAQICHEGFSTTAAKTDICPADQSLDMRALVQTESTVSVTHLPRTDARCQTVSREKTPRLLERLANGEDKKKKWTRESCWHGES